MTFELRTKNPRARRDSTDPLEGNTARPEAELILCASRVTITADTNARMWALLRHELNWDFLLRVAHAHGILPLLNKRLEEFSPDWGPPAVRDQLRALSDGNARRNLLLTAELLRLLELFRNAGVTAIPYKGPALAAFVYGDFTLRQTDDLDILVMKQDVWKACEILQVAGFKPVVAATPEQMPVFFKSECDLSFVHPRTGLAVEIHWALVPPFYGFPQQPENLWHRLSRVRLAGTEVPMLSLEDLLLALCIHGTKHLWKRLEWISCLAALTRAEFRLDWERAWSQAASLHGSRMLLLGLSLARDLSGAELPARVKTQLQADKGTARLARQIRESMFSEEVTGFLQETWFRLRARERIQDRIRYCLARAWTPTYQDLDFIRLRPPLFFLYYIIRPFRLSLSLFLHFLPFYRGSTEKPRNTPHHVTAT